MRNKSLGLTPTVVREHGLVEDGSEKRCQDVRQRRDSRIGAAAGLAPPDGERHQACTDVAGGVRRD